MNERQALERYLMKKYELNVLPTQVKNRLSILQNSEDYKFSMATLLRLFRSLESELNAIRASNIARGNNMEGSSLLLYDLAIATSKYNQFVKYESENSRNLKEIDEWRAISNQFKNVKRNEKQETDGNKSIDEIENIVSKLFYDGS